MTIKITTVTVLLLLLAACNQPPVEKKTTDSTDYANRIATMPEGGRNAVFIRALMAAGLECQKVVHSVAAGNYQGMPLWAVSCRDSGPWAVAIGKDGVAQIFNSKQVKFVAAPPK